MNTQFRKTIPLSLILIVVVMALSTLACSLGSLTLNKDSANIVIVVTQQQINRLFETVTTETNDPQDSLLSDVTSVEMHEGYLRVFGTHTRSDGAQVDGSYDVSLSAENDALQVQVIAVQIEGLSLDSPHVQRINARLAEEMAEMVRENRGEVLFKNVSLTEGKFELEVQVMYRK